MKFALAPIKAAADERAALRRDGVDVDCEGSEHRGRGWAKRELTAAAADERALLDERVGNRDADGPGEMVVAGAGVAKKLGPRHLAKRAGGRLRGDSRQRLDRLGDSGAGNGVATLPTLPGTRDDAAVDKAG